MKGKHILFGNWRRVLRVAPPLLAVLFSLMLATVTQAAVVTNTSVPINITLFVPCANGGAGEIIEVSGPLHVLESVTFDGHGGFHVHVLFNPQDVTGTGLTTGDKYQGTGETQFDFNGTVGFTNTYVNNFNMIGQGPGNNFKVHENAHITVNADGTITAFVDNFSFTCQ